MKRSVEFLEGYNACAVNISRTRNPYPLIISAETVEALVEANVNHAEWYDGWNKRFHGEDINSEP